MSDVCTINGVSSYTGRFKYAPPVWDDLQVPVTSTKLGGVQDPTFAMLVNDGGGSTGVFAYYFSAGPLIEELFFSAQMSHTWLQGSDIHPHVHWSTPDGNAGDVLWGLEYSIATIGAVFPPTTIIYVLGSASGTALTHQISSFPAITMVGRLLSTMLMCRIFRFASDPTDTYPSSSALLEVDFHFKIDAPGSRQETLK